MDAEGGIFFKEMWEKCLSGAKRRSSQAMIGSQMKGSNRHKRTIQEREISGLLCGMILPASRWWYGTMVSVVYVRYGMVPPLKSVQDYVEWTSSDPKGRKTVFHPFGQLLLLLPAVFTYEKRVSYGTR